MISAGEVGAVFVVKDEASVVLRAIAAQMNALQGTIDKTAETFKLLKFPPGLAGQIGKLDKLMTDLMGTAGKLDKSMEGIGVAADAGATAAAAGFGRIDVAIGTTMSRVATLKKEMDSIGRGMGNGGGGGGGSGGHGGSGRRPGSHGGSSMHFGAHERFGPMAIRAVGDSALPMAAGLGLLLGGYESEKQAFDVATADNNMSLMGMSPEAIARANAAAMGMSRYGMSQVEGLNALRTASVPLNTNNTKDGGIDAAISVLPTIGKFDQLARRLHGDEGGDATKQVFELLKSGELRNQLSPEQMSGFIADYAQVYEGTGGKVDPKMFYQGLKYAKSAGIGFSSDFVKYTLPGLELEEGGSTAGTMLMTTESALLGNRLKKPASAQLRKMGILNPDNSPVDQDLLVTNPFEWFQQKMMPAMKASGFNTKEQQLGFLEKIFNRNAAETGALLGINPGNVERTGASIKRADFLNDATNKINENDPGAALGQAFASLKNLGASLAGPTIPSIISGLQGFSAALTAATGVLNAKTALDVNKALFKDGVAPGWLSWIESNWQKDERLFPQGDRHGPHGVAGPTPLAVRGRDPRSPQSGTLAYTPPSAPVSVSVSSPLQGTATAKFGNVTVQVSGQSIAAAITGELRGVMEGMFHSLGLSGTNGSSGPDGRSSPAYPDHVMHGTH